MANGGPEHLDPNWWQTIMGGAFASLVAFFTGSRRARTRTIEEDSAMTAVSLEAHRSENAEAHEATLREVRELINLLRLEGEKNRAAIYALGSSISSQVAAVQLQVGVIADRTSRAGWREGD